MPDQQSVFPADQVGLLDTELQCPLQQVFAKWHAGPPCLPAPLEPPGTEAVLDGGVDLLPEAAQRVHDRFANGRSHDRVQGVTVGLRVVAECLLQAFADGLGKRLDEIVIVPVALVDCLGQDVRNVGRANFAAFDARRDRVQCLSFCTEQQFL